MKKKMKYSLVALFILTWGNLSNAISQEYRLQVSLAGDVKGRIVYLKNAERDLVDSTVVRDGQLRFTGTIQYPALYTLTVKNEKQPNPYYQPIIPVFMEDSIIDISAHVDSLSLEAHFGSGQYKYDQVRVQGSASHQVYLDYLQSYQPFFDERRVAFRKYLDYLNYGGPSKTVQEGIALIHEVDKAVEKRNQFIKQYIMDHAADLVTIGIATDYINFYNVLEIEEIIASIPADILATLPGSRLLEKANKAKRSAVGAEYTDLPFEDDKGKSGKAFRLRRKGEVRSVGILGVVVRALSIRYSSYQRSL